MIAIVVAQQDGDTGVVAETETRNRTKRPRLFKALMHNDDYTTREFVVFVLQSIFHKSEPDAVQIMLHVHHSGVGVAGVYTKEIADTKVRAVERLARAQEFPLRMSVEPADDPD